MNRSARPDLAAFQQELEYTFPSRTRNIHPGKWRTVGRAGGGYSFLKFDRLSNHPDFRRVDFMATARNAVSDEPLVRISKPTAKIDVILVADLSLSMGCGFSESKVFQTAKLAVLFGYTAFRVGDRFGFLGFDNAVREEFYFPPVLSETAGLEIGEELLNFRPSLPFQGTRLDFSGHLPGKKSLLVLVSDFYFPPRSFRAILQDLRRHQILPILLRQEKERRWPRLLFGLLRLKDSESRRQRTVFFSPRMIRRFEEKSREDEAEIRRAFLSLSVSPLTLEEMNPQTVLRELMGVE